VFVALVGEKFDAHTFLQQVAEAGVGAVIVSKMPEQPLSCPVIEVPDTLKALQNLAAHYRASLNPLVIGLTGSNGKTSTKDLLIKLMSVKHNVCGTLGNLNNHIGLPLSILQLNDTHTCGVFEMGMNHPGEIAPLAAIAKPDAAIITNVGIAHIEFMGSRAAIALEKGMLAEAVPAQGVVVLNANDDYSQAIATRCTARVLQAGIDKGDVFATALKASPEGTSFTIDFGGDRVETFLPVPGEHMVCNATLAAALAWHQGITPADIANALRESKLTKGRLETKTMNGVTFLDDSYNANPDSMKAGLRTLAGLDCKGVRVAVLGRMGELGEHAVEAHQDVGRYAVELGIDAVFTVGHEANLISESASNKSATLSTKHFNDHADCATYLRNFLKAGDLVLLKGSRSSKMEQILTHLQSS
jgi:UDP-N-acetylmuramoyl-tripeptide--D-alanyl-D-alanine ligase